MWLLMPRKDVTDGFFRIQMLVALGLSVLAVLTLNVASLSGKDRLSENETADLVRVVQTLKGLLIGSAVTAYAGHIFWKLGRRTPGRVCIYLLGLLCLGALVQQSVEKVSNAAMLHQVASDLSSAAVLGAMLTGMLLGHWYLTTPTMSIQPLTWFARILFVTAMFRMAVSGYSFKEFGWISSDTTHTLWLSMRLIGGIVVPAATSLMVVRILQYRNTQSATGVLFAGLILVFMGEMTAALLEQDLGIPF